MRIAHVCGRPEKFGRDATKAFYLYHFYLHSASDLDLFYRPQICVFFVCTMKRQNTIYELIKCKNIVFNYD